MFQVNTSVLERTRDELDRIITTVNIHLSELPGGRLKVQCVADLYNAFKTQTELILEEDKPRLASVLGTRDSESGKKLLK